MVSRNSGKWRLINWVLRTHEMAVHLLATLCKWPALANTDFLARAHVPCPYSWHSPTALWVLDSLGCQGSVCASASLCTAVYASPHEGHSELLGAGLSSALLQLCLQVHKAASSKQGHPCSKLSSSLCWDTSSVKCVSLLRKWYFRVMKALSTTVLDALLEQVSKSDSVTGIAYVSVRNLAVWKALQEVLLCGYAFIVTNSNIPYYKESFYRFSLWLSMAY